MVSQNVMLERGGKSTGSLSREKIIKVFRAQLEKVSRYIEEHSNFQVLYVSYNELVGNPLPSIKAVNEFLGGGLDTGAMLAVVDPSLYRQRR